MRLERLIRLMRMEGSVGERVATASIIILGFVVGLSLGRFLLQLV
jgi:hypothetical protein